MTTTLPQLVVRQLPAFVGWMAEFYISNNDERTDSNLSLFTKADFDHFKISSTLLPSPIAHTPGPARTPSTAVLSTSDSQITLINFKKEPRGIYLCIPHSRVRSTMTPSIAHSTLPQGHKALGTFSTPYSIPSIAGPLLNCFSVSNSPSL